jgi:hypothetical protein
MRTAIRIEGRQCFDEYILVAPGSDYGRAMWSDIEKLPNGTILESALQPCGKALTVLHHIHFSFAINRKIQLPFQNVWKALYSLETVRFDSVKKYCVIYTDVSAARTDLKYLAKLKERKNITMVLVMVNTMARRGSLIEKRMAFFDLIYSFDQRDCDKYGFIYHPTNYSMVDMENEAVVNDAFYVGVSKGRAETIAAVQKRITSQGGKAEFYISGLESGEKKREGIHYDHWLNYRQVLDYIRTSNCIVEIMDGKQEGVTLRTMEAICYNKKLLTNNPVMRESKYFRTGNIQVFENPDEIDVDFVKNQEKVDYEYEGEFSPIHLIEHINHLELEKQK